MHSWVAVKAAYLVEALLEQGLLETCGNVVNNDVDQSVVVALGEMHLRRAVVSQRKGDTRSACQSAP